MPISNFFHAFPGSLGSFSKSVSEVGSNSISLPASDSSDIDESIAKDPDRTDLEKAQLLLARTFHNQHFSPQLSPTGSLGFFPTSFFLSSVKQPISAIGLGAYGLSGVNLLSSKANSVEIKKSILNYPNMTDDKKQDPTKSVALDSVPVESILIPNQTNNNNNNSNNNIIDTRGDGVVSHSLNNNNINSQSHSFGSVGSSPISHFTHQNISPASSTSSIVSVPVIVPANSTDSSTPSLVNQSSYSLTKPEAHNGSVSSLTSPSWSTSRVRNTYGTSDLEHELSASSVSGARNSTFFPDARGTSAYQSTTTMPSLTSHHSSFSTPAESNPKPANLVSLLDRFSAIGDVTRSAEMAGSNCQTEGSNHERHFTFQPIHSSVHNSRHSSIASADLNSFTAPFSGSTSPWNQPVSSSNNNSHVSRSFSFEPAQYPSSSSSSLHRSLDHVNNSAEKSNVSFFAATDPAQLSTARSPIVQSIYSSVFSSPASHSPATDIWQSSQVYNNNSNRVASLGEESHNYRNSPITSAYLTPSLSSDAYQIPFTYASSSAGTEESTPYQPVPEQSSQAVQHQYLQHNYFYQVSSNQPSIFNFDPNTSFYSPSSQSHIYENYNPSSPRSVANSAPNSRSDSRMSRSSSSHINTHVHVHNDTQSHAHNHTYTHNAKRPHGYSPNPRRSALLKEFRSNGSHQYELRDISGSIVEFCGDQYGSRFIQSRLKIASNEEKGYMFNELLPESLRLMSDVFGNYVIQKYFELGSEAQKAALVRQMEGHVLYLSLHTFGCRVVQKSIECISTEQQVLLVSELDGHIIECSKDQNGNHVIQKAIEQISLQHIQFIADSIYHNVLDLATHPYGCRIIQRMLELPDDSSQDKLLAGLHCYAYKLMDDKYGNYVMQHIIEHGRPHDRDKLIDLIFLSIVTFSRHKFSSNVVEKCIIHGSPDQRRRFVEKILEPTPESVNNPSVPTVTRLSLMMKDQFANYVIQKLLEKAEKKPRNLLVKNIKMELNYMKKNTVSKHVTSIERLLELVVTEKPTSQNNFDDGKSNDESGK